VGEPGACQSEAPFKCSNLMALPTNIRLGRKGFSETNTIAIAIVNYGRKKFYNLGPCVQCHKILYVRNLLMIVIS
jgi:hypothetical protein